MDTNFMPLSQKIDSHFRGTSLLLNFMYQFPQLIHRLSNHNVFIILADTAYDDQKLFRVCEKAGIHLATQVKIRKAKSPDSFQSFCRRQNWHDIHQGLGKSC